MASIQGKSFFDEVAMTDTNVSEVLCTQARDHDFVAYINVPTINAATTVTGIIEHSPDGVKWFTLASFTAIAGSADCEIIQINSASLHVLQNVRATATLAGATKSATVTIKLLNARY
jgi:hypothetical protein